MPSSSRPHKNQVKKALKGLFSFHQGIIMTNFDMKMLSMMLNDPFVCEADKWYINQTLKFMGDVFKIDANQIAEFTRILIRRDDNQQNRSNKAQKRAEKRMQEKIAEFKSSKQSQSCFVCEAEPDDHFKYHERKIKSGAGDIIPLCGYCYPVLEDLNSLVAHDAYRNLRKWARPHLANMERSKVAAEAAKGLKNIWNLWKDH